MLILQGVDELVREQRVVSRTLAVRVCDEQHALVERRIGRTRRRSGETRGEGCKVCAFGQHVADKVATFGGSWTFIILFGAVLAVWVVVNTFLLIAHPFDPYPYILLNLFLSMLAALQAPVIMMSQNRQASKDRLKADLDYEVNLKAELEVAQLHSKVDRIYEEMQANFARLYKANGIVPEPKRPTRV